MRGFWRDLPTDVLSEHFMHRHDNQGHCFKRRHDRPSAIICFGKLKYGDLSALYLASLISHLITRKAFFSSRGFCF